MDRQDTEAARCASAIENVLDRPSALTRRLRRMGGPVVLRDAEGSSVVMEPTAEGIVVREGQRADIEFDFTRGALDLFADGHLPLTPAILDGYVVGRGDLRPTLAVMPILEGLLRDAADPDRTRPPLVREVAAPALDSLPPEVWSVHLQGVHKAFGTHQVLKGVDLRVPEGAVTVILGPSGTGKSVMIKHLIGLLSPDRGDVLVHGRRMSQMSMTELLDLRRRYGILFQDGALFGSMSIYDNVAFPLRQHTDLSEQQIRLVVEARLDDVGLLGAAGLAPSEVSGGMRKRAGFARALVLEPEIVLFDEPDSGLDPVRTSLLSDLALQMHPRYGGMFLFITHNIALAERVGQYFALLWQGKVVAAGTREAIFGSDDPFVRQFLAGDPHGPLGMD